VTPIDINNSDTSINAVSSEALYGFYLAGLSSWSSWVGNMNHVTPHSIYTSIGVAQVMFNDLESDGVLDGMGFNIDRSNLMPLAIGVVPLNTETYRAAFSLHMLAVSNIPINTTNLKPVDLQFAARDLATKTSTLFTDQQTFELADQAPTISPAQPLQSTYGGTMTVPLAIGGYLGAETISVTLDGTSLGDLPDSSNPVVTIDTSIFTDGDHTLDLSAVDALGHTATTNINLVFDNTNPVVNVTSSTITNSTTPTLRGTYSDNLSSINSIVAGGTIATINPDGTWEAGVTVAPGENFIPIIIIDDAGNQTEAQTSIFLDQIPPVVDTTAGHSMARFSNGNGGFDGPSQLLDTNESVALYIETNRLDLDGTPISRVELDANLIPFFAFQVSDDMAAGISTAIPDITVRMRYEKDGSVIEDWRVLPVPGVGAEYLIPLASETLSLQWHQATPAEVHTIRVEVSDPAGNITEQVFTFRADFYVPNFASSEPAIEDLDMVNGVTFADRQTLYNTERNTIRYTFTNPGNKAIYIQPADNSTHTVSQTIAEELRHHMVTKTTATEWRLGLADIIPGQCPTFSGTWELPTLTIWNWSNAIGNWEQRSRSDAVDIEVLTDDLSSLTNSTPWAPAPDFGDGYAIRPLTDTISISEDYKLTVLGAPAFVTNVTGLNCPDLRNFEEHETYDYVSLPGYPRDEVTNVDLTGLPDFNTTGFTVVVDGDIANPVQPVSGGWYPIPANAQVAITKKVTTPILTFFDDDFTGNASYTVPGQQDINISWFVYRQLELNMIHDNGETNIPDMPQRQTVSGAGTANYQINR